MAVYGHTLISVNESESLVLLGGLSTPNTFSAAVWQYRVSSTAWTQASWMPEARAFHSVAQNGTTLFLWAVLIDQVRFTKQARARPKTVLANMARKLSLQRLACKAVLQPSEMTVSTLLRSIADGSGIG
jgi:Galactose oxidase, central domain